MKTTNREWARENNLFRKACEIAGIPPKGRQASKYRRQKGLAYKYQRAAQSAVDKNHAKEQRKEQKKEYSARI